MDWIKRNILFVVGSAVALVLMGLAAYYLMSGMRKNEEALEKLNLEYAELDRLNKQKPHPGDEKTDNVKAAKQQQAEVRGFVAKAEKVFQPVPPIPQDTNLNNAMFAGALRRTIDRLQADAGKAGVQVPTNFYFSFTAVRDRIMFDKPGLAPLARQLGEVKAIAGVLVDARINALDSVRREKVSVHDMEAQQTTDYLAKTTVTNDVALISPYEISFRCFSSELAAVLAGFASSPYGLIVRGINVEPATLAGPSPFGEGFGGGFMPGFTPPVMPEEAPRAYYPQPPAAYPITGEAGGAGTPYGEGGQYGGNRYDTGNRYTDNNRYTQGAEVGREEFLPPRTAPTYALPPTAIRTRTPSTGRGGLPTMLDEKQLKVTMLVEVVKLTPKN